MHLLFCPTPPPRCLPWLSGLAACLNGVSRDREVPGCWIWTSVLVGSPSLIQASKPESLRGLAGYCLSWRGTQPPHLLRRLVSGSGCHYGEESPGVGQELSDDLCWQPLSGTCYSLKCLFPTCQCSCARQGTPKISGPAFTLLVLHLLYLQHCAGSCPLLSGGSSMGTWDRERRRVHSIYAALFPSPQRVPHPHGPAQL